MLFLFLVSQSLVCFYLSEFIWMGHVMAWIKFSVIVAFDLSYFVWLGCVGAWLKFSVVFSFCFFLRVSRALYFIFGFGFI